MIDFHTYLLQYHSSFKPLAGVTTTETTTYQLSYYRQYVTVLCQHDIISLQGRDTTNFLQGQLCGDVRQLSTKQALWTAHCTPKGRVFATLLLTNREDSTWAFCPASNAPALIERLRKYILFSKLTIEKPETKPYLIECSGPDTATALTELFPELPNTPMAMQASKELQIIRLHGKQPRWLIIAINDAAAVSVWEALAKTHCPIGLEAHRLLFIEAGLVDVGKELQETFLPQMIDLDKVGAMSLKKGCYVGQEVIARTSSLGKLKRKLYRATLTSNAIPAIGQNIEDNNGAVLGTCVNACCPEGEDTTMILAVLAERGLQEALFCEGNQLQSIEPATS